MGVVNLTVRRLLLSSLFVLALPACSRLQAAAMSAADRVNAALPVSARVCVVPAHLAAWFKQAPDTLQAVEEQVDA